MNNDTDVQNTLVSICGIAGTVCSAVRELHAIVGPKREGVSSRSQTPTQSLASTMYTFTLSDAQAIVATKQRTLRTRAVVAEHFIGTAWIRLMDIEFAPNVLASLDPGRVTQVKRSMRERGMCKNDPLISLIALDAPQSAALRAQIHSPTSGNVVEVSVRRGQVSTSHNCSVDKLIIRPLTTIMLDYTFGRKLQSRSRS